MNKVAALIALLLTVALAGCTGSPGASSATPSPGPTTHSAYPSLDKARFGDRSGNPSCEKAINAEPELTWRQVQVSDFARMRFRAGGDVDLLTMPVNLKPGVAVQARKDGSQWALVLSVPGSQPQETLPGVREPIVRAAFYDSCRRQLFMLRRVLTVHDEPAPADPVELPAGTALVVTDAYQYEGGLYWTVEDQQRELGNEWPGGSAVLPLRYTVSAKELTAAATRS